MYLVKLFVILGK